MRKNFQSKVQIFRDGVGNKTTVSHQMRKFVFEYLAVGLKPDKIDVSRTPIAYDRTLLKKGEGTNVLFVNGLVKFCRPEELEKLGIITGQKTDVQVGVKKGTV